MGFCYFLYSGGVVVGLWATPLIANPLGWPAVYITYTIMGLAWAVHLCQPPDKNVKICIRSSGFCMSANAELENSM